MRKLSQREDVADIDFEELLDEVEVSAEDLKEEAIEEKDELEEVSEEEISTGLGYKPEVMLEERGRSYSTFPLQESIDVYEGAVSSTLDELGLTLTDLRQGTKKRDSKLYELINADRLRMLKQQSPRHTSLVLAALARDVAWYLSQSAASLVGAISAMTGQMLSIEDLFQEAMLRITLAYESGKYDPVSATYKDEHGREKLTANLLTYAKSIIRRELLEKLYEARRKATTEYSREYRLWTCSECTGSNVVFEVGGPYTCSYCGTVFEGVSLMKPIRVLEQLQTPVAGGADDEELLLQDLLGDPVSLAPFHTVEMTDIVEGIRSKVQSLAVVEDHPELMDVFDKMYAHILEYGTIPTDEALLAEFARDTQATTREEVDEFDFELSDFGLEGEFEEEEVLVKEEEEEEEVFLAGPYKVCNQVDFHDNGQPRILPIDANFCDWCNDRDLEMIEGVDVEELVEGEDLFPTSVPEEPEAATPIIDITGSFAVCYEEGLHEPESPIIWPSSQKFCAECNNRDLVEVDNVEISDLIAGGAIIRDTGLEQSLREAEVEPSKVKKKKKKKKKPSDVSETITRFIYICSNEENHVGNREKTLERPYCHECNTNRYVRREAVESSSITLELLEEFKESMARNPTIRQLWEDARELE